MMFGHRVLLVVSQAFFLCGLCSGQEYRGECHVWQDLIERVKEEDNLEVDCIRNQQCTGFDCKGKYIYQGLYTLGQKYTLDICFGIFIRPCTKPKPKLHFYTEVLENNSTFQRDVDHSDIYQIPGSHFTLPGSITADGFIRVDMNDTTIRDQQAMEVGMIFKLRTTIFGQESYPDDFKVILIPDTYIPVPRCNARVVTPPHVPHTCGYDQQPGPHVLPTMPAVLPTSPAPVPSGKTPVPSGKPPVPSGKPPVPSGTTPVPPWVTPSQSDVPLKPCKPSNSFRQLKADCGQHEMCVGTVGQPGHCDCMQGYAYNVSQQMCVGTTPETKEDIPFLEPGGEDVDDGGMSKKTVIIIALCSMGGLFILAAMVVVSVFKYRQYKRRYGQHDMLLNNEDDPIEVAT